MNAPPQLPSGDTVSTDQIFWSGGMTFAANGSKIQGSLGGGLLLATRK